MAVDIQKTIVELDAKLDKFNQKFDQAEKKLGVNSSKMTKSVKGIEDGIANFTGFSTKRLLAFAGVAAAALSVNQLKQYADAWTTIQNKLKAALDPSVDLLQTNADLLRVANDTRTSLDATATLFSRVTRSTEELNRSEEENLKLTELINKSFTLSGATAQEASSAIIQLSQAFASGKLSGDEFRSVAEQAPTILEAISKATGKSRGELKKLAEQQLLTTDVVITSIEQYAGVIEGRFARTQATFAQSMEVGNNNLTTLIGTLDDAAGITSGAGASFVGLTENLLELKEPALALIDTLGVMNTRFKDTFGPGFERLLGMSGDTFERELIAMGSIGRTTIDFLEDAFLQFPENVDAAVRISIAEIIGFLKEAELQIVEIRQAFNIFTGDDAEAGALDQRRRAILADIELNKKAKDEFVADTLERRDAAIESFTAQLEAAKALREAKGGPGEEEDFGPGGEGVDIGGEVLSKEDKKLQKQLEAIEKRQEKLRQSQQIELEIINERIVAEQALLDEALEKKLITEAEFIEKSQALGDEMEIRKEELAQSDFEKLVERQERELTQLQAFKTEQLITEEDFQNRLTALTFQHLAARQKLAEDAEKSKGKLELLGLKRSLAILGKNSDTVQKVGAALFLFEQGKAASSAIIKTIEANRTIAAQLGVAAGPAIAANTAQGALDVGAILAQSIAGLGGSIPSGSGGSATITTGPLPSDGVGDDEAQGREALVSATVTEGGGISSEILEIRIIGDGPLADALIESLEVAKINGRGQTTA